MSKKAVITGASAGIGAVYAERLARRGYDLVLVARRRDRLATLAAKITEETGRGVEIFVADLNDRADRARLEEKLRTDGAIAMLVNNAGMGIARDILDSDADALESMIDLNVTALMRLTRAVAPAFVARGEGAIINIGSVVGIAPEVLKGGTYSGTKAFVGAFTLALHEELAKSGVRVQAVLPGAIATEFWDESGIALEKLPPEAVMATEDVVDAALAGFDQGELVTIPSLPDLGAWEAYETARRGLMPNLSRRTPASRYARAA
jgi:short-subunit dehydrogenase